MPPRKRKLAVVASGSADPNVRSPKKETGGNARCDQAWIEEVGDELHPADQNHKPPGFLYDVRLQWEYLSEDLNPDFFEQLRPKTQWKDGIVGARCTSTAFVRDERGGYIIDAEWVRLKRPCLRRPIAGGSVCEAHGARIPAVKAAAAQRLAEASEVVALRLIGMTDVRDEEDNPVDHKDRISAANSVLDRAGIKGGIDVEITTPGFKRVLSKMFGDETDEDD